MRLPDPARATWVAYPIPAAGCHQRSISLPMQQWAVRRQHPARCAVNAPVLRPLPRGLQMRRSNRGSHYLRGGDVLSDRVITSSSMPCRDVREQNRAYESAHARARMRHSALRIARRALWARIAAACMNQVSDCQTCPRGFFCPTGSAASQLFRYQECPAGSMCPSGSSASTLCEASTYQDEQGQSECLVCTSARLRTGIVEIVCPRYCGSNRSRQAPWDNFAPKERLLPKTAHRGPTLTVSDCAIRVSACYGVHILHSGQTPCMRTGGTRWP